ncbi:MAG: GIY-YIG nuclease family protein [bacterium]|nr:GIY-YIG nuclease family protein [bacterium]
MDSNSHIVYALKNLNQNYIYVGMTQNIERRIAEHNAGACRSTSSHAPFLVIYTELQPSRIAARAREKYLKSGIGKEFLKSIT